MAAWEFLERAPSKAAAERIQKEAGITNRSFLCSLATVIPFSSFPIDIMHLFYNISKEMIALWKGLTDVKGDYVIGKEDLKIIDQEMESFGSNLHSGFGRSPKPLSRSKNGIQLSTNLSCCATVWWF